MDLNIAQDRYEFVGELLGHTDSVLDAIHKKNDFDYVIDLGLLQRINEKLCALKFLIVAESNFKIALNEMEEMKTSDEDSKWTFPLEKGFNDFLKDLLLPYIDSLIKVSRSWNLDDYRARDFQSKLGQKMEMLRDWYKEHYNL